MALARDDNNKAEARKSGAPERVRPATTHADTAVQRMLDLQGSIGNGGVVQMLRQTGHEWAQHQHGAGCGHETQEDKHAVVPDTSPEGQAALVAGARNSPSESLPSAVVAKAVPFYQNQKIASTRVHRDEIAQRATAAMGAEAMTIDNHIFLSAKAANSEETIGHELSHVDKNTRGIVETGHSNGAGVTTTDPRQSSEHVAGVDGHAYAAGEATAPSVTAQRKTTTDPGEELP
ncbi:eCIS core domain-containing protein [Streptomyces sp. NPDC055239]